MTNNKDNKGKEKLYMMMASEDKARRDIVSTFSINSIPVKVLFDSGASFSFITIQLSDI